MIIIIVAVVIAFLFTHVCVCVCGRVYLFVSFALCVCMYAYIRVCEREKCKSEYISKIDIHISKIIYYIIIEAYLSRSLSTNYL